MSTLARLALEKVPITQIWEEGLLKGPEENTIYLDANLRRAFDERLTLEGLYKENLINEEIDPDLFMYVLNKVTPDIIWPYIGYQLGYDYSYPETPLLSLKEQEEYAREGGYFREGDFQEIRNNALEGIALDIASILKTPGQPQDHGQLIYTWTMARNPNNSRKMLWKILFIYKIQHPVNDENEKIPDISRTVYCQTLDEMIATIHDEIRHYAGPSTLLGFSSVVSALSDSAISGFATLKAVYQADTRHLWQSLEEGEVIIDQDCTLAIPEFKMMTRLIAIGEYLYCLVPDPQPQSLGWYDEFLNYYSYYTKSDAILFLTSLFIEDNRWFLNLDSIYQEETNPSHLNIEVL